MRLFGLAGYPLAHSWSEEYFRNKFKEEQSGDCVYQNFPLEDISLVRKIIQDHPGLSGLNITIPHKINVLQFIDEISPEAASIGAVNCIRIKRDRDLLKLKGFNTDAPAFQETLLPIIKMGHEKALVLGTGGAARAVAKVLVENQIKFKLVSRKSLAGSLDYSELNEEIISEHTLIINSTPLGMWPDTGTFPIIPYQFLSPSHFLYDLVYNPKETLFLTKGKMKGASTKNGLEMLRLQAELSWKIWNQ